jgi:hypothetical protein
MNTPVPLPILGHILYETNHQAAYEVAKLSRLIRQVADLPADIPIAVVELGADAIGWQRVRVLRALEGKETP